MNTLADHRDPFLFQVRIAPSRCRLSREDFRFLAGDQAVETFYPEPGIPYFRLHLEAATGLGRVKSLPVHGTFSPASCLVLTRSESDALGLAAPVRALDDCGDAPRATLLGPLGHHLEVPVVVGLRHLHLLPERARKTGMKNGDFVFAAVQTRTQRDQRSAPRDLIFAGIEVRVDADRENVLHLDREEAAAAGLRTGDRVRVLPRISSGTESTERYLPHQRLITEYVVRRALREGLLIKVTPDMIITPAARDLGRRHHVFR